MRIRFTLAFAFTAPFVFASVFTSFCANVTTAAAADKAEVSSAKYGVYAGDKGHIFKFDADGNVVWKFKTGSVHRIQQLPNGNVLCQAGWRKLIEISADGKKIVWSYDAQNRNGNKGKRLEVHAFQRLENGNTMLVENGIGRIIEVNKAGEIQHELKYKVKRLNAHQDVRQGHKLKNGNYLICHEVEGRVTEYKPSGEIAWNYPVPLFGKKTKGGHGPESWGNKVFNAIRLPSGNTLIATGNGHSVIEVTADKKIVWHLKQHDIKNITLAWVTSLEVLPNGNIIVGNCHAGPSNPQMFEITKEKKVVWTFKDFKNVGNSTAASATVGVKGNVIR
jgi:hypothetical protein